MCQIRRSRTTGPCRRGAALWREALALLLGLILTLCPVLSSPPALAQADPCPEPNDTFAASCFVGPGTPTVRGFIAQPGDVDAYRFEIVDPLARLHIELADLPADYDLHLFDSNAAVLAESLNQGTAPDVIDVLMIPGTYFLFVNSPRGQANPGQPYRLTVNVAAVNEPLPGSVFTPCPEPNDTPAQACPLTSGQLAFGLLRDAGDVDLFGFDVPEANSLVNAVLGTAPSDVSFEIVDASGAVLDHGAFDYRLFRRVPPGRYFIRVIRETGEDGPSPYPLLVTITPPSVAPAASRPDACPEPNDDYDHACNVGLDAPALGYIATPSDADFYTFQVPGGHSWVHVELTDLPADYDLSVQSAAGQGIGSSANGGTFPEVLDLDLEGGKYYILVASHLAQSKSDQPYKLSLSIVPLDGHSRPAGTVLFADTFDSRGAHFADSVDTELYEVGHYDGEYVVKMHQGPTDPGSFSSVWEIGNADLQDFQLDLDARVTELPQLSGGFIVSFRLQDPDNQYQLYVDTVGEGGPGRASLTRWADGDPTELVEWVRSPAIHKGRERNHVTIRAEGSKLSVAINGQPVLETNDGTFSAGDIGLGAFTADRPTEARFDNVIATGIR